MRMKFMLVFIMCCWSGLLVAKPVVGVSILPEKYFVERIAGKSVDVIVMVGEGYNPVTYEPKPKQLTRLTEAEVFFLVGVPFEKKWIRVFKSQNPNMMLVSLADQVKLRQFSEVTVPGHSHGSHSHGDQLDPHFWLNPMLVKIVAKTILETLVELVPGEKNQYQQNYDVFIKDLDDLDQYIRKQMAAVRHKDFAVFHPSWGYFADEYGLKQIAIQVQNRQSGARTLHSIITEIKEHKIKTIFVQKQFSDTDAAMIARETGAKLVPINPLAENYINNLQQVSMLFAEALQ